MVVDLSEEEFRDLICRLRKLPKENEWVEFKTNFGDPEKIAQYVSGLSNSAVLQGEPTAFMVWGIADSDHSLVDTNFDPHNVKKGNEELIPWLSRVLSPSVEFKFQQGLIEGKKVVLLRVKAATRLPVKYKKQAFIRVGSYLKRLEDEPELEPKLFRAINSFTFEDQIAESFLDETTVLQRIDYPAYFKLNSIPLPEGRAEILDYLSTAGFVEYSVEKKWSITNLGALLYANDLNDFPELRRRACRVIVYEGTGRIHTVRERSQKGGYATAFSGLVEYIVDALPAREVIEDNGLRVGNQLVPTIVIRELLANAIMHQDFLEQTTALLVEVFEDRVEFLNPGTPLVDPLRFIDSPSKTRNPKLADALRRAGIVEEKGSGWDKITSALEQFALPPARTEKGPDFTRVKVFGYQALADMDPSARVVAVYQHACLNYVNHQDTNNQSVRRRFHLPATASTKSKASRLLREAKDEGMIEQYDSSVGVRSLRYVPFWAETKS